MKKICKYIIAFMCLVMLQPIISKADEITRDISLNNTEETVAVASTQSGQWIQAADGRWWYRHSDGSYTTSGWEYINGKWYYFDADGWMVTGWQHLKYGNLYNGNAYWNYFNSSGAFATDSDVKGCSHGYSNYSAHKCTSGCTLKYCISTSKKSSSDIRGAANNWNNASNCSASLTEGSGSLSCHINVTSSTRFDPNVLATTYYFYNGNTTKPQNTNWSGCQIDLNENISTAKSTITHEFGHAFGLSHRISDKNSIMCQTGRGGKWNEKESNNVVFVV